MSLRCALKILKEKGLIDIESPMESRHFSKFPRCPYYIVSSKKIDLISRIYEEVSKSTDYICGNIKTQYTGETDDFFHFIETEEVDKWLEDNCKEEETEIIKCEDFIKNYIEEYTDYRQSSDCRGYLIINEKVRENRIKKEKDEEEKAIELFESII